jgi:hypothetical protein
VIAAHSAIWDALTAISFTIAGASIAIFAVILGWFSLIRKSQRSKGENARMRAAAEVALNIHDSAGMRDSIKVVKSHSSDKDPPGAASGNSVEIG